MSRVVRLNDTWCVWMNDSRELYRKHHMPTTKNERPSIYGWSLYKNANLNLSRTLHMPNSIYKENRGCKSYFITHQSDGKLKLLTFHSNGRIEN